jgi:probable HAF family extracellular repeat protein
LRSGPRSPGPVTDINVHGQVVGSMGEPRQAFLWEDGAMTDLGTPYAGHHGASSYPEAVNDHAQVVGRAGHYGLPSRAFLWEDGVFHDLGTLGGDSSEALGINDAGTVVGRSETPSGQWRAFIWRHGRMRPLRVFGGEAVAHDVNAAGVVVGQSITGPPESPQYRGLVWDRGRATELVVPGDTYSAAYAISGTGDVVGFSGGPGHDSRSVLWRPRR